MASANIPWRVRSQSERAAPETRKREVSLPPLRSRSSVSAQEWLSVAQSQSSPLAEQMPWPYWVILTAVQRNSGRAAMRPETTLVLPTLRECPPMTTRDIVVPKLSNGGSFSSFRKALLRGAPAEASHSPAMAFMRERVHCLIGTQPNEFVVRLSPNQAVDALSHESHRWAVR